MNLKLLRCILLLFDFSCGDECTKPEVRSTQWRQSANKHTPASRMMAEKLELMVKWPERHNYLEGKASGGTIQSWAKRK